MKIAFADYNSDTRLDLTIIELDSFTPETIRQYIKSTYDYSQEQVDKIDIEVRNNRCDINIDFQECGIEDDDECDWHEMCFVLIG